MSIEEEVISRIKPTQSEKERILKSVQALMDKVSQTPAFSEEKIEMCLVGSIAKGTYLANPDIDLFLLFEPGVPKEKMEDLGVKVGKEAVVGEEHYAEHPYIRGEFEGLKVDIVPAYKIVDASQKMTAVDRTPFHTEYIKSHLKHSQTDEVCLLKQFMKGVETYGAEIKTQGFSGYLCELLILKYDNFKAVLEAANIWKNGQNIGFEPSLQKFDDALIFIDPVDYSRNVASPVSAETMLRFAKSAKAYLEQPDTKFFIPHEYVPLSIDELRKAIEGRDLIGLHLAKPDIIDDIFYGQLRKFEKTVAGALKHMDFRVLKSKGYVSEPDVIILLELETRTLPDSMMHNGPPVHDKTNSDNFLQKWQDNENALSEPYTENGHWQVTIKRKYTDATETIKANIQRLDIGKDLNKMKDDILFMEGDALLSERYQLALSKFIDDRMPWEW